jgi:GTP cyclohydrolase II/3,4-dihydroxy 2-butanone 4-phosphate synthase/GTP cyclohydrolase II
MLTRYAESEIPTRHGRFRVVVYRDCKDGSEHVAIVRGEVKDGLGVLTRVHSECWTSEVLGSLKCDCREQF